MRYKVYDNRVKLIDSYIVPKAKYERELISIRNLHPSLPLWENRGVRSMRCEWATHNLLYSIGIKRDKTKDCDINFSLPWYMSIAYAVVGTLALLIVK